MVKLKVMAYCLDLTAKLSKELHCLLTLLGYPRALTAELHVLESGAKLFCCL